MHRHAPLKLRNRRSERSCPWLTPDLQTTVRKWNALHRKLCRDPTNDHLREMHKEARRSARKMERQLRNQYFRKMCDTTQPRRLWRVINSVAGRKRGRACVKAKIDELNSTFGHIVHDAQRPDILPVPDGPASASSFFSFEPVTSHDVLLLPQSVDINKATGSDDIPGLVLKSCASALAPSLTLIFNVVLKSGTIPALYKRSNVSPLFKSGYCHKPSNYRPVSLLPILSRLLEKIVQSQLMSYLYRHDLLPCNQFAYRAEHSTEDALVLAVTRWQEARHHIARNLCSIAVTGYSTFFVKICKVVGHPGRIIPILRKKC